MFINISGMYNYFFLVGGGGGWEGGGGMDKSLHLSPVCKVAYCRRP